MTATTDSNRYRYQIILIGALFFIFGFVTWLNGILIPFLKTVCQLSDRESYYVTTAFFTPYFFIALPSSGILNRVGTRMGMSIGLIVMALGSLLFIPAAGARSFPMFLTGLFIQGSGLALLQTAANPYISVIGPIESAARRISIMGICNKFAGIVGNLLFGSVLLANANVLTQQVESEQNEAARNELLNSLAQRVEMPYIGLAIALAAAAFAIWRSSLPDISTQTAESDTTDSSGKTGVWQFPQVWLGAIAIFVYVGAEVMAGDLITTYGKNLGFSPDQNKYFTSFGLTGLLLGYVTGIILIPKYVTQERWLSVSALLGIGLTLAGYFTTGSTAVASLAAMGFANAVMWPAIFPLGIKNLGRFTNTGSAILIMGIIGGALIPPFYGWLYEKSGLGFDFRSAFLVIMLICYTYILFFGFWMQKSATKRTKTV